MRAVLALALVLAGCAHAAGRAADTVPFGPAARAAELLRLRDLLAGVYSHLDSKRAQWGVDLEQTYATWLPIARAADTWARYERAMVGFLAAFHDAHLAWRRTRGPRETHRRSYRAGVTTRFVGGALVVTAVEPESGAARAGLAVGDRLVAIAGATLAERMGRLAALRSWSRAEAMRYDFAREWSITHVDEGAAAPALAVTRERGDGEYETLSVALDPPQARVSAAPAALEVDGVSVLHLPTLEGGAALTAFIDEHLPRTGAVVIDLRGNAGGHDRVARHLAGLLAREPLVAGWLRVRLSAAARAAHAEWRDLPEDPARPGWSGPVPLSAEAALPGQARQLGPVAVLVDAGCRSSCEALALLLRGGNARLFGERTGGSSGAPIPFTMPSSRARVTVPAWALYDRYGRDVEGNGIIPDEVVLEEMADVLAGRDRALEQALDFVKGRS
jgi:carboxyl-terminal processing protease